MNPNNDNDAQGMEEGAAQEEPPEDGEPSTEEPQDDQVWLPEVS
jgi:hypothetical protein